MVLYLLVNLLWLVVESNFLIYHYNIEDHRHLKAKLNCFGVPTVQETWFSNSLTFFPRYWIFRDTAALDGLLDIANLSLPNELHSMDAALELSSENYAYFFKGDKYWRYNWSTASIDQGYPQAISSFWNGLPDDVDAAFRWKRGRLVVLKGGEYYSLKRKGKIGVKKGFPKMFASSWLGCVVKNLREH